MGNAYVGEIRMFAGNFAPSGWAFCDGRVMDISQYDVLFTLIGTTYGGDGQTTFNLPDLRSRIPVHQGTGSGLSTYVIGQASGAETVAVTTNQMPVHNHSMSCLNTAGNQSSPANAIWAISDERPYFNGAAPAAAAMNSTLISQTGSSQPHENHMPYLAISFIISLYGVFPSRS